MQNRLGLRYTVLLNNGHRKTQCGNEVSRYTVNLTFRRILPEIAKIRKYNKEQKIRLSGKSQGIDK